jgi:hypothetical protein
MENKFETRQGSFEAEKNTIHVHFEELRERNNRVKNAAEEGREA